MPKKLAIFCDGTWNQASKERTNVVKLFEATCSACVAAPPQTAGDPQIAYYVKGVGTRREEYWRGGAFGYGISDNIKDAYSFIVANFEAGDQLFLFGFSRGAFTARSLAGLIRNMGVLRRDQLHRVDFAYEKYRDKACEWAPDGAEAVKFRKQYSQPGESIEFIGVWDTVGALGAPYGLIASWLVDKIFNCSFHDAKLSSWVQNAYHALAADERRWPFRPTLMELNDKHRARNAAALSDPNNKDKIACYEEKWFPGVHSDVGGGYAETPAYPEATGLSDIALQWMAERAQHHGLNLNLQLLNQDPDATVQPEFKPNIKAEPHDSRAPYYTWLTKLYVYYPNKLPLVNRFAFRKDDRGLVGYVTKDGDYVRPINVSDGANVDALKEKQAADPNYAFTNALL